MTRLSPAGYVVDVPYLHRFTRELTPDWLDAVVTLAGFTPPDSARPRAWCELGCGHAVTACVVAGTRPDDIVHAIDVMPEHIGWAEALARDAGIANLALHATDFAAAARRDLPAFDYIVAHGVYSWIDDRACADLIAFVDRHLAPGGVLFLSYNALPGWTPDAPLQRLVRELADVATGDSEARVGAAMDRVAALAAAGAPALRASWIAAPDGAQRRGRPLAYLAHEYLPRAWRPRYVTEVRADVRAIGLDPAGSATIVDNFDAFVLPPAMRAPLREALRDIEDPDRRELLRDYCIDQRFRRDVFVRGAARLDDAARRRRVDAWTMDAQRPAEQIRPAMHTEAGLVSFEGPAARAVIDALTDGARAIGDIAATNGSAGTPDTVRAAALALFAANEIQPVRAVRADVARLNAALLARPDVGCLATSRGTAIDAPAEALRALCDGTRIDDALAPWVRFLEQRTRG